MRSTQFVVVSAFVAALFHVLWLHNIFLTLLLFSAWFGMLLSADRMLISGISTDPLSLRGLAQFGLVAPFLLLGHAISIAILASTKASLALHLLWRKFSEKYLFKTPPSQ